MNKKDEDLKHYGVLGMKWGIRRATYKLKSQSELQKSKSNVKKDIDTLKIKANDQKRKAAKNQTKAAKYMSKGDFEKASKYFKKSAKANRIVQKREKTQLHNEKLLKLYDKRLTDFDKLSINESSLKIATVLGGPLGAMAINKTTSGNKPTVKVVNYNKTKFDVNKDYKNLNKEDKKRVDYLKSLADPGQKIERVIDGDGNVRFMLKDKK